LLGGIVALASDSLGGAGNLGSAATHGLLGDLLQTAEDAVNGGTAVMARLIDGAEQTVGDAIKQGVPDISGLLGNIETAANDLGNDGLNTSHGLLNDLAHLTEATASRAAGTTHDLLSDVLKTTSDGADHGVGGAHNLVDEIITAAGGLGSGGIEIGHSLLSDLIKTVNDGGNNGIDAAHHILSDLDAVLADLGGVLAGGSHGSGGPLLALDVLKGGNGGVMDLTNDLTGTLGGVASGLGLNGSIANLSVLPQGNGSVLSTAVGHEQSHALIDFGVLSNGSSPSQNLIDVNIGPRGSVPQVALNVLAGPDPGEQSPIEVNGINVGPNGHTLLTANVLTSPDQFHFPSLNGSGTDQLVGAVAADASKVLVDTHLASGSTLVASAANHSLPFDVPVAGPGDHALDLHAPGHGHGLV
jgi:hypothetical protein